MPPEKTYTYLKLKFKKTTGTKLSSQSVYDLVTQYLIVAYFLDEYRTYIRWNFKSITFQLYDTYSNYDGRTYARYGYHFKRLCEFFQ